MPFRRRRNGVVTVRAFRRYLLARTIAMTGNALTLVALPILAFQLTASAALTALLTAAEATPYLVLGLPIGALVDRLNRRTVMVACGCGGALLMISIPLAAVLGGVRFEHLLLVAIGVATLFVFQDAASFGALPLIVGRARIAAATSLLVTVSTVVGLAGPALGGVLVATAGAPLVLGLDGLGYLAAAVLMLSVRWVDPPRSDTPGTSIGQRLAHDIGEGVRYLWRQPAIRALTALGVGISMTGGAVTGLLVVIGVRQLDLDPDGGLIGLLYLATAVGTLLASSTLGRWQRRVGVGRLTLTALIVAGLAVVPLALASSWAPALAALVVYQFGMSTAIVHGIVVRQVITPDHLQGRVNTTARLIAWGATPVGATLGGLAAEAFGVRVAVALSLVGVGASLLLGLLQRVHRFPALAELAPANVG